MHENYFERIGKILPEKIISTKIVNDGWANIVIEINGTWIFRFSRSGLTKGQMAVENSFLPRFEKISPIPVPHIEYAGDDFMGYKKINGIPLRSELLKNLTEPDQTALAQSIGSFLSQLHSFDFSNPQLLEFPYGGNDFWKDLWPASAPLLSENTKKRARDYFEKTFDDLKKISIGKKIIHADLGTSNLLFNPEENRLAGIIDFGDICLHDPARDFNGILRNHGKNFTQKVLEYYDCNSETSFWNRIEFYARRHYFMIVFYAPLFGFADYIPNVIEEIEKIFSKETQ